MATKKVKKFGRGGDILTGLGAGLAAYGAYKHFFGDKDKEQTSTGRDVSELKPQDSGKKGEELLRDAIEGKKDDKKAENKTDSGRNSSRSPVEEHGYITKRSEPSDNTSVSTNVNKPKKDNKKGGSNNTTTTTTNNASSFTGMAGSDKGAPRVPALKGGESKVVGEGELRPYPEAEAKARKAADRQKFLESQAGMRRTGIATPGKDKNRQERSKGRSANPIQETIDNAGKSMARTPQQKMSERAREVQRRREEEMKSRYKKGGAVKKYASGGSVKTAKPTMRSASSRADGIAIRGKTRA
jgi:hypothetical protein